MIFNVILVSGIQQCESVVHKHTHTQSVHSLIIFLNSHYRISSRVLFVTPWTVACTRLLQPWDCLGKSTGVGCHFLLHTQCIYHITRWSEKRKGKSPGRRQRGCPPGHVERDQFSRPQARPHCPAQEFILSLCFFHMFYEKFQRYKNIERIVQ